MSTSRPARRPSARTYGLRLVATYSTRDHHGRPRSGQCCGGASRGATPDTVAVKPNTARQAQRWESFSPQFIRGSTSMVQSERDAAHRIATHPIAAVKRLTR
jgi:hypothetical protein